MITMIMRFKLYSVGLLVSLIGHHELADEDGGFFKGRLLYESVMTTPESVKGWKMEGPGTIDFRDGWVHMFSPEDKMHHYHISYYANNPRNPGRGHANLRKNNKFILVQKGEEGIPTKSKKIHKIRLIKDGSQIVMFVDERKIIDWTDDGKTHGPVYTEGRIGFRQMKWTHFRCRNFRV